MTIQFFNCWNTIGTEYETFSWVLFNIANTNKFISFSVILAGLGFVIIIGDMKPEKKRAK